MIVLSVDSATESASCAVINDNKLLGEINYNYKKQHSIILMDMIDELLQNLKLDITEIDGFVVSKGPGSFTGLRIGIATIKGLSQGVNKPFIGISSLDALAFNMAYCQGIICPILDALRGNVYTALYTFNDDSLERISDYMAISIEELITMLKSQNKEVTFLGDAADLYKDKLKKELPSVHFAPGHLNVVKAASLGELGLKHLMQGEKEDIFSFAPMYLRKSQAEREYEKKEGNIKNE